MSRRKTALGLAVFILVLGALGTASADIPELAGNWHLDTLSSTTPDSSGHNLNGAKAGSPTVVAGRFGNALHFPTESDYINAGNHAELQPATVSALAWVRSATTPPTVKGIISQGAAGSCSYSSYSIYTGGSAMSDAGTRFYVHTAGGIVKTTAIANSVWDGQWHLLTGTYDGTTARIYVDGTEAASGTGPGSGPIGYGLGLNNDFIIGGALDASCVENTNFTGDIDEVRVYNRVLSQEEIAYLAGGDATTPRELPIPPPEGGNTTPGAPAGRNVTAPSIQTHGVDGGLRTYECLPGTWANITGQGFQFTWWRRARRVFGVQLADTQVQTGANPLYKLPKADAGRTHYCEVTATGLDGQPVRAVSQPRVLTGEPDSVTSPAFTGLLAPFGNVRVRGIDVFQVVQPDFRSPQFPAGAEPFFPFCGPGVPTTYQLLNGVCTNLSADAQRAKYRGVSLDARKKAWARVYVNMVDGKSPYPLAYISVTLTARLGNKVLGTDPWGLTVNPPATTTRYVTREQRTNNDYSVAFPLDPAWLAAAAKTSDDLSLEANIALVPNVAGFLDQCIGDLDVVIDCGRDDRYRVDDIPVRDDIPNLTVKTLALTRKGQNFTGTTGYILRPATETLERAIQVLPGGQQLNLLPYSEKLDIETAEKLGVNSSFCRPWRNPKTGVVPPDQVRFCRMGYVNQVIDTWKGRSRANRRGYDLLLPVHHYHIAPGSTILEPGWQRGGTLKRGKAPPIVSVNDGRTDTGTLQQPLTSGAHELMHAYGAPHADRLAPDPATNRPCGGGGADGKGAEAWSPDNTGRLQGAAFDKLLPAREDGFPDPLFDLMSYCGTEADAWLSAFNWTRALGTLRDYNNNIFTLRARTARAGDAYVVGVVGPGGAEIARVVGPDPGNAAPDPDPSSPIQVRALGAGGRELAVVGAPIQPSTEDPSTGVFTVSLPSGTEAVELVSGGQVLDRRARTRPPTVRLSAPRAGTRVGGGPRSALVVRWTASDPERDELDAAVEYAANGRSNWRTVFSGPSTGNATIPGRFLERSNAGRVRIKVNDGFSDATAVSGLIRAEGRPPAARIILPDTSVQRVRGRTELVGTGFDDRGQVLRGRSLTWFAGRRRLGSGERLLTRLPAGRVVLRLQARDRFGRVATATRRLVVDPVHLDLRRLEPPDHVAAGARSMKVTVATSTAATLKAGGRRYLVGPRAKVLLIPLPRSPRTGILRVNLSITARGVRQRGLRTRITVLRS